ncbi:MAG: CheR family methyltransferase [Herbaspirillum sp.]
MKAARETHSGNVREFKFTESDFERVRKLIYQQAGIALADSKREMVYSRLARRLRVTGVDSFTNYLDQLEQTGSNDEQTAFVNALTTNLTSFFRESHHFPILADHVRSAGTPLTVWCCASSTGEEPYSIAITLCEVFGSLTPPVRILATDIDTNVLTIGAHGVYPNERIDKLTVEQKRKFFLRGTGAQEGLVRVRPQLSALIEFTQLNLLASDWSIKGPFDVIFCRNVMIYFDKPTQTKILSRFAPLMKQDGLLFAGHSENFSYITNAFKLRAKTVYQLAKRPSNSLAPSAVPLHSVGQA